MLRRVAAAAVALLAMWPAAAVAETARPFEVTARIVAGCIVSADATGRWGAIDLGTVAGIAGARAEATLLSSAGAGIAIECTPDVVASLSADNGDHPVAGERTLQRAGGTATIRYRLYANGATTPWAGSALPLAAAAGRRFVPIRAVATLTAPAPAGTYTDTVRITLTW